MKKTFIHIIVFFSSWICFWLLLSNPMIKFWIMFPTFHQSLHLHTLTLKCCVLWGAGHGVFFLLVSWISALLGICRIACWSFSSGGFYLWTNLCGLVECLHFQWIPRSVCFVWPGCSGQCSVIGQVSRVTPMLGLIDLLLLTEEEECSLLLVWSPPHLLSSKLSNAWC